MACIGTPTRAGRIVSRFGVRAGRATGAPTFHAGVDWAAPRGTPIYAPLSGVVALVGRDDLNTLVGYGNAVVIHHPDLGLWSLYAHMDRVLPTIVPGMAVRSGKQLGFAGNTTNGKFSHRQGGGPEQPHRGEMGPHLHEEWRTAKPNGASPFPGAYGVYNIDPLLVYTGLGRAISRSGMLVDDPRGRCDASALMAAIQSGQGRRQMAGMFAAAEAHIGVEEDEAAAFQSLGGLDCACRAARGLAQDEPESGRSSYAAGAGIALLLLGAGLATIGRREDERVRRQVCAAGPRPGMTAKMERQFRKVCREWFAESGRSWP